MFALLVIGSGIVRNFYSSPLPDKKFVAVYFHLNTCASESPLLGKYRSFIGCDVAGIMAMGRQV